MIMLNFNDYANGNKIISRIAKQGYYDIDAVKKNFGKVLSILGEEPSPDPVCVLNLRLKNRVQVSKQVDGQTITTSVKTDYPVVCAVAHALEKKITRRFWRRRGRYESLPMVFAIESSKNWDKEHIHAVIRFHDLKQYFSNDAIASIVKIICNHLNEVNEKDHTAIDIRMLHYSEDYYDELGNTIEYVCKTSANHVNRQYDPIIKPHKYEANVNTFINSRKGQRPVHGTDETILPQLCSNVAIMQTLHP